MGLFERRDNTATTARITVPTARLVRAPSVATKSFKVSTLGTGSGGQPAAGGTAWTDEQAWKAAYYANVWVYRCAQVIAEDIAAMPIRVGEDPLNPGDYDPSHPLAILLGPPPGTPNPTTSSRRLLTWTVAQFLVTGRWAWEIEYGPDSGLPMFLWPLPSSRVTPIPSDGGQQYFKGYEYDLGGGGRGFGNAKGNKKVLPADKVFYEWKPAATDWRDAENVLQAAKLNISVAAMQDRYDFAFLKNDARPATVVVHEQFANVDERDAWRSTFTATHGGVDNAGKIAFAEASPEGSTPKDSMLIQTLGMNAKDARMIERYDATLRLIEAAFGVPRSRLGDASGRTYSNAGEEWAGYYRTTIKNLALDMADAINTKLAPKFGMSVCWFDFTSNEYLRDEPPFPVEEAMPLYRGGVVTLNEVRTKVLYLPPVDDGDDLVIQEVVAPSSTELPGSPNSTDTPDVDTGEVDAPEQPTAEDLDRSVQTRQAETGETREAQWRQVDRTATRLESKWERAFQRLFDKQLDAITSRLNGKRGRQYVREVREGDVPPNPDAIFDRSFWMKQTEEMSADLYEDVVDAALSQYQATIGISFEVANPWVQEQISQRANQLAGQVTDTTYKAIKRQLNEGVAQGESIPKLADRIERLFQQTYRNRATVVARTEVISSYNGATTEAIRLSPPEVAAGKEWLATFDDRTREEHGLADGQVVAADASFTVGGESLRYPGDPSGSSWNVIQCRCTIIPVPPEKMEPTVPAPVLTSAPQSDNRITIVTEPAPPQQVDLRITVDQGKVRKTLLRDDEGTIIGTEEEPA